MQIKTTVRYYQLAEWVKNKENKEILTIPSVAKNVKQLELSYTLVGMQNYSITLENSLAISYVYSPYDLGISRQIYSRETKT